MKAFQPDVHDSSRLEALIEVCFARPPGAEIRLPLTRRSHFFFAPEKPPDETPWKQMGGPPQFPSGSESFPPLLETEFDAVPASLKTSILPWASVRFLKWSPFRVADLFFDLRDSLKLVCILP